LRYTIFTEMMMMKEENFRSAATGGARSDS
jgi:hypothetical protein